MSKFFETIYTNKQYNFIIVFLFIIALIRSIIDDFWIPYYDSPCMYLLTFFNTEIYIYLLYFSVGGLSFFYLEKIWKIKPLLVEQQIIYFYSTFLWISYPVVSLISMIAKSPPMMDIPFFKYFPFFMIHRNFFPLGMILVIPVLIAGYTCIISTYSRVSYFKAFIALLPGFFIIYLLFYQYLLRFCYYLLDKFNIFVFFGCYNLMFILFTWIFLKHFLFIYNKKGTLLKGIFILLGIISILLLPIGVYLKNKSVPQSSDIKSLSWKLFLIVVPEDGDKPGGYGFVLVSSKEKKLRVYMKIARSEINCCSFFSHSENGFQINDIRFNYNDSDKLIFQWNKHNTGRDSFLNTFEGRDYLYSGTLFLDGNDRKCIILREEISADEKKIKFWDYETFLF